MNTISVEISPQSKARLDSLLVGISGNADRALSRAINRTLRGVRTDITKEITSKINLRRTEVLKSSGKKSAQTFKLRYASDKNLSGAISTQGANIPLIWYSNAQGKSQKAQHAKTIRIQVRKNRPKILLRHAFIPKLKSGHRGLFMSVPRTNKIREMFGPKIPGHLLRPEIYGTVEKKANIRLDNELSHQIDLILTGY